VSEHSSYCLCDHRLAVNGPCLLTRTLKMNNSERCTSCDLLWEKRRTLWTQKQSADKTIPGLVFSTGTENSFNLWCLLFFETEKQTDSNEERLLKRDCENRSNNCTIVKTYTRFNRRYSNQHKYRLLYCSTEFVLLKFKRVSFRVKHLCTPRATSHTPFSYCINF